jgi:tRNA nucleotidyltransferase (CCA-adding enzyme)
MKIVLSHQNSDLDAIASMVAAQRLYPGAVSVVSPSLSPPVQRFLALHKDHFPMVEVADVDPAAVTEAIIVDVRDRRRLRDFLPLIDAADRVVAWDHHPDSEHDVETDEAHVEPTGACVTLLVDALRTRDVDITATDATLFLLGIYADTGRLSFSTTRPLDFDIAGYLVDKGANLRVVNRFLARKFTEKQHALLVSLMASVTEESFSSVEVAFATAAVPKVVRGMSAVVEQILELGGYDAIFGIVHFAKNDRVQIIARSRVSYVDVGEIARMLGGGGHPGAAAFNYKHKTIDEALEIVRDTIREHPFEPTRVSALMSSPVMSIEHDTTLGEAGELFEERGISGAPVMRDGEMAGVISRRDVRRAASSDNLGLPVSSHMTHNVITVDHAEPVEDVLALMTHHDVGRLVVTRDGQTVGVVTRTDIIRSLYMKARDDAEL